MVYIFFQLQNDKQASLISIDLRAVGMVLAFDRSRKMYFVTAVTVADVTTISMILMRNGALGA